MKPPRFIYHDPVEQSEVLALLETYGDSAKILAGGQSLVPLLNMRLAQPTHLVDINRLPGLSYIHEEGGELAIGALTRHRDVERSSLVLSLCPLLAEAIRFVGHAPIRSRGTVGGSLAHADPAAELPAVLLALGRSVRVISRDGEHVIPAEAFFTGQMQTALTGKELLVEARFPVAPPRSGAAFIEVSRRHGDFALAGAGVQLSFDESGTIAAARLALMGVAETPVRATSAEEVLVGEQPEETVFDAAARRACADLDPPSDLHASAEYRRSVASVLVKRVLYTATRRALQGGDV